jgi:phosphoribosyl-AMP cyclohydrolase
MSFPPPSRDKPALEHGTEFTPAFDANGLVPAIATDVTTGKVLMFAWMDSAAVEATLSTGRAHFYSRSKKRQWMKGEESGNVLVVEEIRVDCDQDVLWLAVKVLGQGVACHTGAESCFYRRLVTRDGKTVLERIA